MSQLICVQTTGSELSAHIEYHDRWHPAATPDNSAAPILSLAAWQAAGSPAATALQLQPDDDPEVLTGLLDSIPLICLQFERFTDGRPYSQASILRRRLGYRGDLRACGDVLRDQLVLMEQCGFSSFLIRADKNASDALLGLQRFRYRCDVITTSTPAPVIRSQPTSAE